MFSRRIETLRTGRGLSRQELADRSGLNARYIGQLERGERTGSLEALQVIAQALSMTLSEFVQSDGEPHVKAVVAPNGAVSGWKGGDRRNWITAQIYVTDPIPDALGIGLLPHDRLTIERFTPAEDGALVVVATNGDVELRELKRVDGSLWIWPVASAQLPQRYGDQWRVLGTATVLTRRLVSG